MDQGSDPNCPDCAALRQRLEKLARHNALLRQRNRVLIRRVRSLQSELQRQQAFRRRAEDRVAELEERTRTNAANSHLPPSANPIGAPPPTPKKPTGRKRGAQPGHRGHGRKLLPVEQVDQRVEHRPQQCQACGAGLAGVAGRLVGRHQVAELPPRAVTITEHQSFACRCPRCGAVTRERIPAAARASACGPRLSAAIGLLSCDVQAARRAVARAVGRMLGCPIALGSVSAREAELADALSEPYQRLVDQAADRPVKYLDETGWSRKGEPHWLFVAATPAEAVFRIERTRTRSSLEQLLGGKPPRRACCSDRAGLYDLLPARRRQLCWAHLKRDFVRCQQRGGASRAIGNVGVRVAKRVFALWRDFRARRLTRARLQARVRPLQARLDRALRRGAHCCDAQKTRGLCRQLLRHHVSLWRFADVPGLAPDNNRAERMLRPAVTWRKTSFGSDSRRGCTFAARALSVTRTLALRRHDALDYLTAAISAHRSGQPAPPIPQPPKAGLQKID